MSQVPAATRALRVLRFLASQPDPVPLDRIMRACDLPRSTAYHLLNTMVAEGFVVHLEEERRYGLGVAAFEVGSGYSRQEPLQRISRRLLAGLVDATRQSAHLAVLHGRDVLYVVEERAPGRPPLVTDVGVRLPAHLTASGRAILAALPPAQVRALYPDRSAFVERHGTGPESLSSLRALLGETRQRGYATEEGEVTPGFASVAAPVLDHNGHPVAGLAVTYESGSADQRGRPGRRPHRALDGGTPGGGGADRSAERSAADPVALEQPTTMGVEDLLDHVDELARLAMDRGEHPAVEAAREPRARRVVVRLELAHQPLAAAPPVALTGEQEQARLREQLHRDRRPQRCGWIAREVVELVGQPVPQRIPLAVAPAARGRRPGTRRTSQPPARPRRRHPRASRRSRSAGPASADGERDPSRASARPKPAWCTNSSTGQPRWTSDSRKGAGAPSSSTVTSRSEVGVAVPCTTLPASQAARASGKSRQYQLARRRHSALRVPLVHPASLPE